MNFESIFDVPDSTLMSLSIILFSHQSFSSYYGQISFRPEQEHLSNSDCSKENFVTVSLPVKCSTIGCYVEIVLMLEMYGANCLKKSNSIFESH